MQASKNFSDISQLSRKQNQSKEVQFHSLHSFQSSEHVYSGEGSQSNNIPGRYCTLESSVTAGYVVHGSPSTVSFTSTSGSPISQECQSDNYGSPTCGSCISDDPRLLRQKLRDLEIKMLGSEPDIVESIQNTFQDNFSLNPEMLGSEPDIVESFQNTFQDNFSLNPEMWSMSMTDPRGNLEQALITCARAIDDNDTMVAHWLLSKLPQMVSVSGDPLQRLGAYLYEGLVAKLASSGNSIYEALKCKEPISSDLLSYMHILFEACPYFKFAYMSANGAIAEAIRGENSVHIIDFQIAMGTQWITLIKALAARPGGPPRLRITGVDDPVSQHARGGGLHLVGKTLAKLAEACNVPFEFNAVLVPGYEVEVDHLGVWPGEVLVVNFAYQLHHMPDESVDTWNHRDRLIRMVKGLSPRVVTLVEQESNTNTSSFFRRFVETLDFYKALFESIDATSLARDNKERINTEQHCVARDIVNIIACEGAERVERHELLGKWRVRFTMAGFKLVPLSPMVNSTIKSLLKQYNENYRLIEKDGALYLGWKDRDLVTSSAWM